MVKPYEQTVIPNYHNEITWNNSNIQVVKTQFSTKTIMQIKDIYIQKMYYSFLKLQNKFNLPATEFLRYISLTNISQKT